MLERRIDASDPWGLQRQGVGQKVKSIKCPHCRATVSKREVAYVANTRMKQAEEEKKAKEPTPGLKQEQKPSSSSSSSAVALSMADDEAPASAADVAISTAVKSPAPAAAAAPRPVYPLKGSWSSKLVAVMQTILHILATDFHAKILIFSEWLDVLLVIEEACKMNTIPFLHIGGGGAAGGTKGSRAAAAAGISGSAATTKKKMHEVLALFKSNPHIPLLLLPLTSAASGLNIVEANHVILVEPSLAPGKELQAIGRIVRIGQKRETHVHRFIVEKSVEEKIFKLHHKVSGSNAAAAAADREHKEAEQEGEAADRLQEEEDEEGFRQLMAPGQAQRAEDRLDSADFESLLED
jgi:ribosomal protein L12E/L44/L45/RPP1/RPP2